MKAKTLKELAAETISDGTKKSSEYGFANELEALRSKYPEQFKRVIEDGNQNKGVERITPSKEQEEIKDQMLEFQKNTAGASIDQLRKSAKTPSRLTDLYSKREAEE